MSYIKTDEEIKKIVEGGRLMGDILARLVKMVKPGISAWEIDTAAEKMIQDAGGTPAFKGYKPRGNQVPFPSTICASRNEEVVHGIATKEKILQDGDLFTIDIGMEWSAPLPTPPLVGKGKGGVRQLGFFTDTAVTVPVGKISKEAKELVRVTREALEVGIRECRPGKTVADIGRAIEKYVKSQGSYGIVRDLSGHGVGHAVHEEPWVPNFYVPELQSWKLEPGVVIAIEPMITLGNYEVVTASDQWTIVTKDKSLSAHYEHTVVVTEGKPVVVTRRPGEKN